jgi:hypothetical protein
MVKRWRVCYTSQSPWRLGISDGILGYYRAEWWARLKMWLVFNSSSVMECWLERYEDGKWVKVS